MEKIEFIKQKLDEMLSFKREIEMRVAIINEYTRQITAKNVSGRCVVYQGIAYEIIDYRNPYIYSDQEYSDINYEMLCLKMVNMEKDKSEYAKKIRKGKKWNDYEYRSESIKNYHKKNVVKLTCHFTVEQTKIEELKVR